MGLNLVTMMGDSKTIINKCKTEVRDKSILGAIIDDIQSNKTRKNCFSIHPKNRER
ncbi:hypothetical protein Gohar_022199 [Gossypium harknessii]|uniref:RNase H type-1 domain-containing protein n=1 Tax=Gossypium harknessii TaxID=34285 RepID=A0A7J9ICA5_9ROSI|nr:hypothetical protein [Gossypium harknessii]